MHDPDARARIYAEYAKRNPPPMTEIDDPDDPRYYMDADEIREFEEKKLAAGRGKTQQDHRAETMEKIYAKNAPEPEPEEEPNPFDDRPAAQQAIDSFLNKNPEYTREAAWKTLRKTVMESTHPDVYALREKFNKTERPADCEALLARSAEIAPGEKLETDRRAAFAKMAKDRSPITI